MTELYSHAFAFSVLADVALVAVIWWRLRRKPVAPDPVLYQPAPQPPTDRFTRLLHQSV